MSKKINFKIGDVVKHTKSNISGHICGFEFSGTKKALIEMEPPKKGNHVIDVRELELVEINADVVIPSWKEDKENSNEKD